MCDSSVNGIIPSFFSTGDNNYVPKSAKLCSHQIDYGDESTIDIYNLLNVNYLTPQHWKEYLIYVKTFLLSKLHAVDLTFARVPKTPMSIFFSF